MKLESHFNVKNDGAGMEILYTHELLDHDGKPNGVHLGVNDKGVCEQAYDEGETSAEIREWCPARLLAESQAHNAKLEAQVERLRERIEFIAEHSRDPLIANVARAALKPLRTHHDHRNPMHSLRRNDRLSRQGTPLP